MGVKNGEWKMFFIRFKKRLLAPTRIFYCERPLKFIGVVSALYLTTKLGVYTAELSRAAYETHIKNKVDEQMKDERESARANLLYCERMCK